MVKKLPLCAFCGETLRNGFSSMQLKFNGVPGTPVVGWHLHGLNGKDGSCFEKEFEASLTAQAKSVGNRILPILCEIDARGPGRVIAGKEWRS